MKKILAILLTIFLCATATAQMENSIVIDTKSFRAVQTDALTGVNIDPIGLDHSRQACARIKIKFDRMNKAQIDALEVKMRSNTDLTKQKVADYYDNVLILEMTAKPNTRFYFYSPEFGESNEVTLNLEGNREYEMLASLNQTFSIIVNSNVANADVYIDGVFKGKTDSSNSLTIKEVMIGGHKLKVQYGKVSSEQDIEVNDGSISFRQSVNTAANEPQFVVFTVEPQSAVVTIDGKHYTLTEGAMRAVLDGGTYNYTVSAVGYHSQSGTFTVAGSKVTKNITLSADAATVTLAVADNAEIWVNGERVGAGRWSGKLNSGAYIFEARKAGHRTTTTSKHITSAQPVQSYTLETPTPIVGSIMVDGTPINADVALDGKAVGQMPLKLSNLLVGEHKITVSKSGYQPYTTTITIAEGRTATVNATLTKQTSQTSSSGKIYKVGDYYNENGKEGVVFEVSADGRSGKIVSMKQSAKDLQWSSDSAERKRLIGADSKTDGAYNMAKVKAITGWRDKYPAFKWCADLGEGWYLPSIEELKTFTLNDAVHDAVNRTLMARGGTKLCDRGEWKWYWSSTEKNYKLSSGEFCAWRVYVGNGHTYGNPKYNDNYVRAVSAF
ncbi:MAG: PEGA domain-containing protein [Alistipes sp.]|nr:PEGA domain-containing protein [Alistipes sp.]